MAKYVVKNIQCDLTACGLCADTTNVELELQDDSGNSIFLSGVEFESFPNIYQTEKSIYSQLLYSGYESEEEADKHSFDERRDKEGDFFESLNENYCIYSGEGYEEFYDDENCCDDLHEAVRFLIYLIRCDWDSLNSSKDEYVGKTIGEFEIPKCDAELAWEQGVELGEEEYEDEE